jgi:hypothetical protein
MEYDEAHDFIQDFSLVLLHIKPSSTYFCQVASLLIIIAFFIIILKGKKVNLGENPKIGYESCAPLYNTYDRKFHKRL